MSRAIEKSDTAVLPENRNVTGNEDILRNGAVNVSSGFEVGGNINAIGARLFDDRREFKEFLSIRPERGGEPEDDDLNAVLFRLRDKF